MLEAMLWSFAVWLVMGLHLLAFVRAFDVVGIGAAAAAVGGMGLAWAAGLIFIPAPAGAGVRDAVLVATFAPHIGAAPALAVALASRVLLVVADVLLALAGAAGFQRRRRALRG
jgi:MprA protease rhombosortase-interaction domain-containing protein